MSLGGGKKKHDIRQKEKYQSIIKRKIINKPPAQFWFIA